MWTDPLTDLKDLLWKWLRAIGTDKIERYDPNLVGFEYFLKPCRLPDIESVEPTARMCLPFQVQTYIS